MQEFDVVVIGGGSAGMAAALAAYENGCQKILILEREKELGGILQQCIHNGFGLQVFSKELTGPAYAERYIFMLENTEISYRTSTMVLHLSGDKTVEYVNSQEGVSKVKAKAIILAMGCRERTRGAIAIPGARLSGIWTAGTAQRYVNMEGYVIGRRVLILGSGDIGLIMARRMSLEGATVLGVAEIMPYSNGLPRNMKQCLEDFGIPLYLGHTVTDIQGKDRVERITLSQVDADRRPIPGTEKVFEADTLLLSVGLIPENNLSEEAGIQLHPVTGGPIVSDRYETSIPGIFACGNALHVHDLVDYVSRESSKAGYFAGEYVKNLDVPTKSSGENKRYSIAMMSGDGIGYIMPQKVELPSTADKIEFMFRVRRPFRDVVIQVIRDGVVLREISKKNLLPAEMQKLMITRAEYGEAQETIQFAVVDKETLDKKEEGGLE